jgi:hypothetical protein
MSNLKETRELFKALAELAIVASGFVGGGPIGQVQIFRLLGMWGTIADAIEGIDKIPSELGDLDASDLEDLRLLALKVADSYGVNVDRAGDSRLLADGTLNIAEGLRKVAKAVGKIK